jgi:hypothetical protein
MEPDANPGACSIFEKQGQLPDQDVRISCMDVERLRFRKCEKLGGEPHPALDAFTGGRERGSSFLRGLQALLRQP